MNEKVIDLPSMVRTAMRINARKTISSGVEAYGHMSDEWVAHRVRLLHRNEVEFEPICNAARDRILRLSLQVERMTIALRAIHAATGDGGLHENAQVHGVVNEGLGT